MSENTPGIPNNRMEQKNPGALLDRVTVKLDGPLFSEQEHDHISMDYVNIYDRDEYMMKNEIDESLSAVINGYYNEVIEKIDLLSEAVKYASENLSIQKKVDILIEIAVKKLGKALNADKKMLLDFPITKSDKYQELLDLNLKVKDTMFNTVAGHISLKENI